MRRFSRLDNAVAFLMVSIPLRFAVVLVTETTPLMRIINCLSLNLTLYKTRVQT